MSPTTKKWGLVALFVLWLFAVAISFYLIQKPLTVADVGLLLATNLPPVAFSLGAMGQAGLDVLVAGWVWLTALGLGLWIFSWLRPANSSPGEAVLFGAALGLHLLGLLMLGLGLLGWLNRPLIAGVTAGLFLLGLPQLWSLRHHLPKISHWPKPPSPLWTAYLLLMLAFGFSLALLPPTDWDGLFYHLTGPKLYLAAGQISGGIDIPHLNFPSLFQMLFMQTMALRGDESAVLLHFGFVPLLMGLVYVSATRQLGLKQGWAAVIVLASMPMLFTLGSWAYNDLTLAYAQILGLYALLKSVTHLKTAPQIAHRWVLLSGLACGLAMSLKYTSAIAPVVLGLMLWGYLWRARAGWPTVVRLSLVFGLSALAVASPWYVKNWVLTGNPVYPFVFEGVFWDAHRAAAYAAAGTGLGFDPLGWVTLPYTLTLGLNDANYIDGRMGPLFLAFLPLILLYSLTSYRRAERPPLLAGWLIFALGQYAYWMLGVVWSAGLWQSRLLLAGFVALCPVIAWIWQDLAHLNHPQFSLARFLRLLVAFVLILGLIDALFNNQTNTQSGWLFQKPWRHLAATETEAAYLTRRLGTHYQAMEAVNALPSTAQVVFLWEPRSYYCHVTCYPDSILDRYGHLQYLHGPQAEAIAKAWQAQGVSHVLIFELGLEFLLTEERPDLPRPDVTVLNDLRANHFKLVAKLGGYTLYALP